MSSVLKEFIVRFTFFLVYFTKQCWTAAAVDADKPPTNSTEEEGSGIMFTSPLPTATGIFDETNTTTPADHHSSNTAGIAIGVSFAIVGIILIVTFIFLMTRKTVLKEESQTFNNPISFNEDEL